MRARFVDDRPPAKCPAGRFQAVFGCSAAFFVVGAALVVFVDDDKLDVLSGRRGLCFLVFPKTWSRCAGVIRLDLYLNSSPRITSWISWIKFVVVPLDVTYQGKNM